jgi:hypothetical protein
MGNPFHVVGVAVVGIAGFAALAERGIGLIVPCRDHIGVGVCVNLNSARRDRR